ncbi:MAG: polymerase sigma factor, sigma-70 family [Bacillales bacterium]|jgi:RNA polymerase sigma-70 factor (ECF subfamily)|nr:polymerase sigma factor, sigma-70 family [Bacillales bacterium]
MNGGVILEFEQYIWQNKEKFYRIAYTYVQNKEDALDIVSESIVKAIKNKTKLHDEQIFKTWFYRIVVNTAVDFTRKNKRVIYLSDELIVREEGREDQYKDFDLEKLMAILPDKFRIVLVLRYFEDMKIEAIADVLEENVNTIKSRLYKALSILKIEMTEEKLGGFINESK